MNSRIYECHVMHARFSPTPHRFVYRLFMLALDLDELDTLSSRLRFFSVNRGNLYSFREQDYLPTQEPVFQPSDVPPVSPAANSTGARLKDRVIARLATHGIDATGGRVELVTLPRIAGYLFNPVSFYFCYGRDGEPLAAIAEVTNTFREMKPYVLGPETRKSGSNPAAAVFRMRAPKHFYVSPFSDVDVVFDFALSPPSERLRVQIDDYIDGERTLTSSLTGPVRPLTDGRLAWFSLKYPFLTLKVIALIHWHAFRLYLKRVPWFRKGARPADQRDLYRPDPSIASTHISDSA